jgi:uncharacterized protein YjbI with pentapeptide repeats
MSRISTTTFSGIRPLFPWANLPVGGLVWLVLTLLTPNSSFGQTTGDMGYRFELATETCRDESERVGLNRKFVGECGDIRRMKLEMRDFYGSSFAGADLRKTVFRMSNLTSTNLQYADMRGADLRATELKGANLGRSDLRKAKLNAADLSRASLIGVDLRGADLSGVVFRRARIINSDLRDTVLDLVDFREATLKQVLLPEDVDPNILPANYKSITEEEFSLVFERRKDIYLEAPSEGVSLLEQLLAPLVDELDEAQPVDVEDPLTEEVNE